MNEKGGVVAGGGADARWVDLVGGVHWQVGRAGAARLHRRRWGGRFVERGPETTPLSSFLPLAPPMLHVDGSAQGDVSTCTSGSAARRRRPQPAHLPFPPVPGHDNIFYTVPGKASKKAALKAQAFTMQVGCASFKRCISGLSIQYSSQPGGGAGMQGCGRRRPSQQLAWPAGRLAGGWAFGVHAMLWMAQEAAVQVVCFPLAGLVGGIQGSERCRRQACKGMARVAVLRGGPPSCMPHLPSPPPPWPAVQIPRDHMPGLAWYHAHQ